MRGDGHAVLEDAACAAGSTYAGHPVGWGGATAAWSFHPRKLLTTGEGGMLTLADADVAARLRRLREHGMSVSAADRAATGSTVPEQYLEVGFNYRMTDIQAAVRLVQLSRLHRCRRETALADRYRALLADVPRSLCLATRHTARPTTSPTWCGSSGQCPVAQRRPGRAGRGRDLGSARDHGGSPGAGL